MYKQQQQEWVKMLLILILCINLSISATSSIKTVKHQAKSSVKNSKKHFIQSNKLHYKQSDINSEISSNKSISSNNLIINGDFEQYAASFCSDADLCYESNSAIIAPWYTPCNSDNTIHVEKRVTASSGTWFLDLNTNRPYGIAQNVNLVAKKAYKLSFSIRNNKFNPSPNAVYSGVVRASGNKFQYFRTSNSTWSTVSYSFTATVTATSISIYSTTSGLYGPYIDNVKLIPVDASTPILSPPDLPPVSSMVIISEVSKYKY